MFGQAHSWWQWLRGQPPSAGDERRIWVRFPTEGSAVVRGTAPPDPALIPARVRDLSRGGIGLVVDRGFSGGNLLLVDLPQSERHPGATVLAYVLRADPLPDGGWALGCAFAEEPDQDGLDALAGHLPAGVDRRAWARLPTRGTCRYYPVGSYDLTRNADVVNVSPAGVGLMAGERIEPGALLSIELARPGVEPLSTIASVVSVSPREDGRWLVGCSFAREMDEDEMAAFWETGGD